MLSVTNVKSNCLLTEQPQRYLETKLIALNQYDSQMIYTSQKFALKAYMIAVCVKQPVCYYNIFAVTEHK